MLALKPVSFIIAAATAGVLLALAALHTGVPTGALGAAALVIWAFVARRRWVRLEATTGLEPGGPERILWLRLAGNWLILGHLAAAILLVGDGLRLGNGNSLAINSWTMILGQSVAALAFRRDRHERDERHEAILARGVHAGYVSLTAAVIALVGWLAYAPPPQRGGLSHFVLANGLIALLLASYGVMLLVQLIDYARDTREAQAAEQSQL